jgi:hypothetical protein
MTLDMTFCSGLRCNKTKECARFTDRIREAAKKYKHIREILEYKPISISQFADHKGVCTHFVQKEE